MGKWAKYSRKYRKQWEEESWAKGWLAPNNGQIPNSTNDAYCKICKVAIRTHITDLKKHGKTVSHVKKMKQINPTGNRQKTLETVVLVTNKEKEREIKLSAYIAVHCSIRSIDHLTELLNDLGLGLGDSSGFVKVKLHRTKCAGIIKNVIAPSLFDSLIDDIGDSGYSLIADESTDIVVVKYLCLCVKYYSKRRNKHITEFLGLIIIENGTASVLYEVTKQYLQKCSLKLTNLLGLGTDGANSLCGSNHSLFTLLKEDLPKLKLVRCVCHSLNNACSKATDELPAHVEFLCREIYTWFAHSSNRKIEYEKIFDLINNQYRKIKKLHCFVQPSNTRWLSRYHSVQVILENWLELKTHFNLLNKKEKDYTARLISEMLNDDQNYLCLKFLKPLLFEMNQINLNVQKSDMDVSHGYDSLEKLFLLLCRKIYKAPFVQAGIETLVREVSNDLALVKVENADFGIDYYQSLSKCNITHEKKKVLEYKMFQYLKRLCFELSLRLPQSLQHFKKLKSLTPKLCLSQIRPKLNDLPFVNDFISSENLGLAELEYSKLLDIVWPTYTNCDSAYEFWCCVSQFKDAGDNLVFKHLGQYAINVLSLPSSNAVVERVFSVMNIVKSKSRNRLMLETLEAILRIRITLYNTGHCCKNFSVTKNMITRFKSDNMYRVNINNETDRAVDDAIEVFIECDNSNEV